MILTARCHCSAITASLDTRRTLQTLSPRYCPCSFCSKHGAVYFADADGHAVITLKASAGAIYYQFGEAASEFLICGVCGSLVAALQRDSGSVHSALNLNLTEYPELEALEDRAWQSQAGAERASFRAQRWTPTTIRIEQ